MSRQVYHAVARDQASLYRLAEDRFQIIRDGALASILTGWRYVLVSDKVFKVLREVGIPVADRAVVVFDSTTASEIRGYHEIRVNGEVTPESISALGPAEHLWLHANRDLFMSVELYRRLADECSDLDFSEGFSDFAAW